VAEVLQYGLLYGYTALLWGAFLAGWRWPRLRPLAFAVGFLSATHIAYYALFLIWPDVLNGEQTLLFSVVLRYQVLFTAALVLLMSVERGRWRG
jgi:hypothetical protein